MTVNYEQRILRLHHDQQVTHALHGCDKQPNAPSLRHKNKLVPGFTSKYNIKKLVYFESTSDVNQAILKEKQIKGWLGAKKIALIESMNPEWKDLSEEWFE